MPTMSKIFPRIASASENPMAVKCSDFVKSIMNMILVTLISGKNTDYSTSENILHVNPKCDLRPSRFVPRMSLPNFFKSVTSSLILATFFCMSACANFYFSSASFYIFVVAFIKFASANLSLSSGLSPESRILAA